MMRGFASTLASVALLVALGAMIGRVLEVSGGAKVIADTLIGRFGKQRAPFALGVTSLLFGFPIFFDASLVVMMPIIFSVAKRFGASPIKYALPSAGAFSVVHAFVPPHPGPVAAAELLGVNIAVLIVIGILVAIPTWYIGVYLFGLYAEKKLTVSLSGLFKDAPIIDAARPIKFTTATVILILPALLIFLDTGLNTLTVAGLMNDRTVWVECLRMLGKTPVALLLILIVSLVVLGREYGMDKLGKVCNDALAPICEVILITGAGGMFAGVLRASVIGDALADILTVSGMPVIVAAFTIPSCLRVAQGSATVALTTTAALIAPAIKGDTELARCFIAIADGSIALSHLNDSGFWLVSRLLGMDENSP